ncbi:MAG: O-antigen ligase family protein [Cyclobacteriaceae bacterium]|nr:O-antigen ligase family protein [Cyclobacteriaceae bacterium]
MSIVLSAISLLLISGTHGALGPVIPMLVIGLFIVGYILYDFGAGVYFLFLLGTFMFFIDRIIEVPIPLGIVYDALVGLTFIAIFLNPKKVKDWKGFNNAITITFLIITTYQLMQFFNPNAVSKTGWLVSMRNNTSFLLYIIFLQLFITVDALRRFTFFWLSLAALVALYGIYQEIFGLTDFEWRWIYKVPDRIKLYFIWGSMRKFSFLSDPSAYGLFTAFGGLASLCLLFGQYRLPTKILFFGLAVIMFVAMSFSGTRTAYAMVAVGLLFLMLLNMNNAKVVMFSLVLVFCGAVVFFGPFYGSTINRIRSTFNPSEDASMSVRDVKRIGLQSYILSHPIGGGLNTTGGNGLRYSPGHPLAEGWDPDSGYLLTALETGWIGLIIFIISFFVVLLKGINSYFFVTDPIKKNYILVYIVPFLALSVAHFTQDAMYQKPVTLIVMATYAIVIRLSPTLNE